MLDPRFAFAPDPKRNFSHHVIHDLVDLRRDLPALRIRQDREIAAGDIEADSTERDFVLVGNDAADWLGVTFVTVGAKHAPLGARRYTRFDLLDRRRFVLAESPRFRLLR